MKANILMELISWHNDENLKATILQRLKDDHASERLVKGHYWENGKGCAVGVVLHQQLACFSLLTRKDEAISHSKALRLGVEALNGRCHMAQYASCFCCSRNSVDFTLCGGVTSKRPLRLHEVTSSAGSNNT